MQPFKYTILYVDDEQPALNTFKRALYNKPYNLVTTGSASEALRIARKTYFDLAVLDIFMPEMNGFQLCGKLQKMNPFISIIMLSGMLNDQTLKNAVKNNCDGFIEKPFAQNDLITQMGSVLVRNQYELRDYLEYRDVFKKFCMDN